MGGGGKPCDMQQACGQSNQQVLSSSKTKVHPVSVSEAAIALKLELLQSVTLGRRGDSVSVAKCGSSCQSFFVQPTLHPGGGGKPCDMQQACGQSNQQVLSSSKTKVHPVSVSEAAIALKCALGFGVVLGGALCLGLCYGLLYLSWEVLCVLRVLLGCFVFVLCVCFCCCLCCCLCFAFVVVCVVFLAVVCMYAVLCAVLYAGVLLFLLFAVALLFFVYLLCYMLCEMLCCVLGCGAVLCWGAGVSGYLILGYWGYRGI